VKNEQKKGENRTKKIKICEKRIKKGGKRNKNESKKKLSI
jgi:hypothetical protein